MEQVVPVKLQPFDAEAFRPYGSVLGLKNPVFPDVDGKHVMLMLRLKRPRNGRIEELAIHPSYNQTFIPVKGCMAMIVAPPPRSAAASPDQCELDYNRVAAFVMEPGDACIVDRGTWHGVVPLGEECLFISGTRRGAELAHPSGEIVAGRMPTEEFELGKQVTPFIEIVDLKKRDSRVLELQF